MDKTGKIEICDRCGKTPNDFKSIKTFHMHLKENNGHSSNSYSCYQWFHVIKVHHKYYIDTTKKSLGFYSDSLIESMHQYLDKLMFKSNYYVKNVESEIHGVKLLKAVKHLNTYNLD